MNQSIKEPVSVISRYDAVSCKTLPVKVKWRNRIYPIDQVALHFQSRQGSQLLHTFCVTSADLYLRLILDTTNLHWQLAEISDGQVS